MESVDEGFYITLLSQYDKPIFPTNVASSFKNRLEKDISLHASHFEVALAEFSFTQLVTQHDDNAKLGIFDFLYLNPKKETSDPNRYGVLHKNLKLDQSNLVTPADLVGAINRLIWEKVPRLKSPKREIFTYDAISNRVWINFKPSDYITIILKFETLVLLGVEIKNGPKDLLIIGKTKKNDKATFEYVTPDGKTVTYTFADNLVKFKLTSVCTVADFCLYAPDLYPNHSELVIYSSMVTESIVAGYKANVLKFVPISANKQGESLCLTWGSSRIYRPLADNHLSVITIDIRSATDGKPVDLAGSTRLLIHIRKKRKTSA